MNQFYRPAYCYQKMVGIRKQYFIYIAVIPVIPLLIILTVKAFLPFVDLFQVGDD